jgi:hypothetical protein
MTAPILDVTRPESANNVGAELLIAGAQLVDRLALAHDVATVDDMQHAVAVRKELGAEIERRKEFFAPFKLMAHRLHRALCDRENAVLEPLQRLDNAYRDALSKYRAREDAERRARERQLADEQRRIREAAAVAEAAELERTGEVKAADAVLAEALTAPTATVVEPDPTVGVVSFVRRYKWRYVGDDPARALKLLPREYLTPDEKKIGAYARAMKGTGTIPGIEFFHVDDPIR